ncbi:unnamed protein product [Parnassius mnemosyne]|uniref:Uncharacterized protein n=1 Tax=Parnassius mnemosyne TaxID=213953 RepID=A0AAV1LC62_9NEOP
MDGLKLFASSRSHLMELLNITCDFSTSSSIRMELGTDKCAVLRVERGRVASSEGIDLSMPINIRTLSEAETYRYLGVSQNIGVDEARMKQSCLTAFCSVCIRRTHITVGSCLFSCIPLAYSGGLISDRTECSGQKSPHYHDVPQDASSEINSNEAVLVAEAWWTRLFKRAYHA